MAEIKKYGSYPVNSASQSLEYLKFRDKMPWVGSDETNPYIRAFWKWWPDLRPQLKTLRITGGEPLLNENTFRLLNHIAAHPPSDLHFCVNTNLMIPKPRIEQFIGVARQIQADGKLRKLSVYTSLDAWGERGAYIRHGLRSDYFLASVEKVLGEIPDLELVFMVTFNALSVTGFRPFLEYFLELRKRYPGVRLDISYLRNPEHMSVKILTSNFMPLLAGLVDYMESRDEQKEPGGFLDSEIEKMKRLYEWALIPEDENWLQEFRRDFYAFFKEHDRRRGTDFLATFPEMADFWRYCRHMFENHITDKNDRLSMENGADAP